MVHTKKNRRWEMNKHGHSRPFSKSQSRTLNSCRSLDYARGNESIICFTDLCKPIATYFYARNGHTLASYPAAKHPKHSKFTITDIWEKPVNFFYCLTRASTLVSAIILLTQVLLQKFSFLFIIIIPCSHTMKILKSSSKWKGR